MGCDIHFWVEKKDNAGSWSFAEPQPIQCSDCEGQGAYGPQTSWINPQFHGKKCSDCEGTGKIDGLSYRSRNYRLFSILANVRNREEGDEGYITPISEPRGIPDDSPNKHIETGSTDYMEHSFSHHTLRQLKEFNWGRKVNYCGGLKKYNDPEISGGFYKTTMKQLEKLSEKVGGDDNVRIVFFFDN